MADPVLTDLDAMMSEIERAPDVTRPSAFWEGWNAQHIERLAADGFVNFKRTLTHNYFTWSPRSPWHEQFRVVALDCVKRRTARSALRSRLVDVDASTSMRLRLQRRTHAVYLALLWEYVRARDPRELLGELDEPELGRPVTIRHRGRTVSEDLCNSVLEVASMLDRPEAEVPRSVIELGGGYGRVAWVLLEAFPGIRYVVVDIPPALAVAQEYLTQLFPDRRTFRFRSFTDPGSVRDELQRAEIAFLTPNQLDLLPPLDADLFVNISSLHEMRPDQIAHYFHAIDRHCSGHFYTKQWKRSVNASDAVVIEQANYPVPGHWRTVYSRTHPLQIQFFEALYELRNDRP